MKTTKQMLAGVGAVPTYIASIRNIQKENRQRLLPFALSKNETMF